MANKEAPIQTPDCEEAGLEAWKDLYGESVKRYSSLSTIRLVEMRQEARQDWESVIENSGPSTTNRRSSIMVKVSAINTVLGKRALNPIDKDR